MFSSCCLYCTLFILFFFKQKTAYEMRISDWSSDVCSSDLLARRSEEACDLGRVLDEVIDVIGHRQLREHIAGEEFPFGLHLLAALDLGHRLDRHLDRLDELRKPHPLGLGEHRIANLVLETRLRSEEHTSELQ